MVVVDMVAGGEHPVHAVTEKLYFKCVMWSSKQQQQQHSGHAELRGEAGGERREARGERREARGGWREAGGWRQGHVRSSQSRPIHPSGQAQVLGLWHTPPFWQWSQHIAADGRQTHFSHSHI